ncbi:MAG: alginate lyase family protein [Chloroflexota bacterium]|nr:alginate lyase family protein [Chloroflexota bacterium]
MRVWLETTSPRMVSAQTLSDETFLARFDLADVRAQIEQGNVTAAKKALWDHYSRRVTTTWPAPPNMIRDLRVNTDELNQDELLTLADSILEHRFVLRMNMPRVTPEGKIAWHLNPTSEREWLLALNRHQWWPILGLAYAQTGDERYATTFVTQMLDWVEQSPPPTRKNEQSPNWRLMEVGMRMRVSWIPCFALFYNSPAFTGKAKLTMLRTIYDHARFLLLFKTNRNHLLRESNGLAYASICFPEFKEADHWRQVALARLDKALVEQFNQDGSHIEVSTGYQSLVIDEFQNTYTLLQANALSLPKEDLASWLERMYHMMAYLIRPDNTFPQVNDGYVYWKYPQLAQAGEALGRDDFVYIGTGGSRGTRPGNTSAGFDDGGLYAMRSDWTKDARYLLFDAGPYGGPHGHEDKLSIELFAFGQAFIVDSSSYTYDTTNPFRAHFVSSQAHNTVLVDGQSQVRRWQEENLNPKTAVGNYATWISQPDFDYVSASYSDGYSLFSFKKPVDASIIEDVTHTRHILFVRPDYWVLVDEIQASTPHNYQVLFHTVPEIKAKMGPKNRVALNVTPEAATLYLIPSDPQNVKVRCLTGGENPIQGWYSPCSGHKAPATVVIYERESRASTVVTTLLYPCPSGQTGDTVSIEPLEVPGNRGLAFVVTTGRGSDYLLFSHNGSMKQFGPYQSRGTVAGIRTDGDGNILSQFEWPAG